MAKSWQSLKVQHDKIKAALLKITPPVPSDEFESMRQNELVHIDKMDAFLEGNATGEGNMSLPGAEPEG